MNESIVNINVDDLKKFITKGDVIIIDVREIGEYKTGHIPGAINVPLSTFNSEELPDFTGKKLVFQCLSGKRSLKACKKLINHTTEKVYNLVGGISSWQSAGERVIKQKNTIPIMRQVQIIVGLLILIITLLSYFVSSYWLLLLILLGLGLLFAGITGFCGLARCLLVLPWNK